MDGHGWPVSGRPPPNDGDGSSAADADAPDDGDNGGPAVFDIPFDVTFTTHELEAWLFSLGFSAAASAVRANELVGADLVGCVADDLAEVLELEVAVAERIMVCACPRSFQPINLHGDVAAWQFLLPLTTHTVSHSSAHTHDLQIWPGRN
jgi:hypothetical protein